MFVFSPPNETTYYIIKGLESDVTEPTEFVRRLKEKQALGMQPADRAIQYPYLICRVQSAALSQPASDQYEQSFCRLARFQVALKMHVPPEHWVEDQTMMLVMAAQVGDQALFDQLVRGAEKYPTQCIILPWAVEFVVALASAPLREQVIALLARNYYPTTSKMVFENPFHPAAAAPLPASSSSSSIASARSSSKTTATTTTIANIPGNGTLFCHDPVTPLPTPPSTSSSSSLSSLPLFPTASETIDLTGQSSGGAKQRANQVPALAVATATASKGSKAPRAQPYHYAPAHHHTFVRNDDHVFVKLVLGGKGWPLNVLIREGSLFDHDRVMMRLQMKGHAACARRVVNEHLERLILACLEKAGYGNLLGLRGLYLVLTPFEFELSAEFWRQAKRLTTAEHYVHFERVRHYLGKYQKPAFRSKAAHYLNAIMAPAQIGIFERRVFNAGFTYSRIYMSASGQIPVASQQSSPPQVPSSSSSSSSLNAACATASPQTHQQHAAPLPHVFHDNQHHQPSSVAGGQQQQQQQRESWSPLGDQQYQCGMTSEAASAILALHSLAAPRFTSSPPPPPPPLSSSSSSTSPLSMPFAEKEDPCVRLSPTIARVGSASDMPLPEHSHDQGSCLPRLPTLEELSMLRGCDNPLRHPPMDEQPPAYH